MFCCGQEEIDEPDGECPVWGADTLEGDDVTPQPGVLYSVEQN